MKKLLYLASPFWHEEEMVRTWRVKQTKRAAAILMEEYGYDVYAPIVHGGSICEEAPHLMKRHDLWVNHGLNVLRRCDVIGVLTLPGWKESRGVSLELEVAEAIRLPVLFFDMKELTQESKCATT